MTRREPRGIAVVALAGRRCIVTTQSARDAGQPLAGITPVEFEEFRLGLDDFLEVETAEEGLGPAFNGTSCAVCHSIPAIGGRRHDRRGAGRTPQRGGEFEALDPSGETLFQLFSVPATRASRSCRPTPNVIARRVPIPLFGAGLVEAIPDDTLIALEDPTDRNGDGVSGRAAFVVDLATGERRVGRFGWKAQHATLLAFGGDAYRNEMGITNDLFPHEAAFGVTADRMRLAIRFPIRRIFAIRGRGGAASTTSRASCGSWRRSGADVDDQVPSGEQVFSSIGCAACHVPALTTGPSSNPLFDRQPVALFSDLLLHDVGTGDGIEQAAAKPTRSARRRCGDCDSGARSCTTDPRPRWSTRSAGTVTRPNSPDAGSSDRATPIARRCSPFCDRFEQEARVRRKRLTRSNGATEDERKRPASQRVRPAAGNAGRA